MTSKAPVSSAWKPGRRITSAPMKPHSDGRPAPPTEHLAEEEGAQEGGEERASEGECGGAGQRSERQADEEGQHGEHVEHRTQHVEADALGVEQAKTVAHEQGKDHNEAEDVAEEGHLHGRKMLAGVADGGVHGREHDGRRAASAGRRASPARG